MDSGWIPFLLHTHKYILDPYTCMPDYLNLVHTRNPHLTAPSSCAKQEEHELVVVVVLLYTCTFYVAVVDGTTAMQLTRLGTFPHSSHESRREREKKNASCCFHFHAFPSHIQANRSEGKKYIWAHYLVSFPEAFMDGNANNMTLPIDYNDSIWSSVFLESLTTQTTSRVVVTFRNCKCTCPTGLDFRVHGIYVAQIWKKNNTNRGTTFETIISNEICTYMDKSMDMRAYIGRCLNEERNVAQYFGVKKYSLGTWKHLFEWNEMPFLYIALLNHQSCLNATNGPSCTSTVNTFISSIQINDFIEVTGKATIKRSKLDISRDSKRQ